MTPPRPPTTLTLRDEDLALATDLYQLTMAAAYLELDPPPRATFELLVRRLPPRRNFLVFAGLEQALASLAALRFQPEHLDYLRSLEAMRAVPAAAFDRLADFRFAGEMWAMPEGSVFFAGEPVLRVTGSLLEAQLVETLLLSIVAFQSAVASKAARVRLAAGDAGLAEFGSRRAHGPQAGVWAARAAYLGGFDSTSNLLAGMRLGIPVVGTMAHSFVLAFDDESEAFRRYQRLYPEHAVLLVDTYDTLAGVERAIALGVPFQGVRLDSGDLGELARGARRLLDAAGRREVRVFASGDLDEERVAALRAQGAPIDAYGVGTRLATVADAPYLGAVYKLVEVERDGGFVPRAKRSADKATVGGRKQVLRRLVGGEMGGDRIVPADAPPAAGETALLEPVMRSGRPLAAFDLDAARRRRAADVAALPAPLRGLDPAGEPYSVVMDPRLTPPTPASGARARAD